MNNLVLRSITGLLLIAIVICAIYLGFAPFSVLFGLFTLMGLLEFYRMAYPPERGKAYWHAIGFGMALYVLLALHAADLIKYQWLELVIPAAAYFFLIELYKKSDRPFENIAITSLGIIYIVLPFGLLNYVAFMPSNSHYNPEPILATFICLWSNDTFAYIIGRLFGKTKLFERISPKKTVEGSIGGIIMTMLIGYFGISKFFVSLNPIHWLTIAGIVSICGIYGDLLESLLKRSFQVKDSGRLLPGHGGILDRFDSLLLAAPMVYTYLRIALI